MRGAEEVARRRAAAQGLAGTRDRSPAALVARFGALQAQDYPYARWALAQRLTHDVGAVDAAVGSGSVLRAHVLRPTWHFVPRDDLRWMQELTSARVRAQIQSIDRRNGIDEALVRKATRTIAAALTGRGHLTRREIAAALGAAGIDANAWAIGQLLLHAELQAVVCSGAPRGRQQTYALVDERAPRSAAPSRDEALATLAARYFQSHGPATLRDFRWWSGLDTPSAARAVAALGRRVERQTVDGSDYLAIDSPSRGAAVTAHLIHPFDEILVAYSESRHIVDTRGLTNARAGGLLLRGVLLNGQLAGRWLSASGAITLEALRRFTPRERAAVDRARARFEAVFLSGPGSGDEGSHKSRRSGLRE